jgi:hypothetical protein
MNLCYYSSNISVTLFSLGYIHRHGGAYSTDPSPTPLHTKVYSSKTLPPIDLSPLSTTNHLPINYQSLSTAAKLSPHLYYQSPISAYLNKTLPNPTHSSNSSSNSNSLLTLTQSPTPYTPSPTCYFNPEQRKRAEELEALHIAVFHQSDASLATTLVHGKYRTHLTSSDGATNRTIRGPCPQCSEGKHKHAPQPPSTSAPVDHPGQVILFDPSILPQPYPESSPTSFSWLMNTQDSLLEARSKSTPHIFDSIRSIITKIYNASGHKVDTLHGAPSAAP